MIRPPPILSSYIPPGYGRRHHKSADPRPPPGRRRGTGRGLPAAQAARPTSPCCGSTGSAATAAARRRRPCGTSAPAAGGRSPRSTSAATARRPAPMHDLTRERPARRPGRGARTSSPGRGTRGSGWSGRAWAGSRRRGSRKRNPDAVVGCVLLAPAFGFLDRRWDRLTEAEREDWKRTGRLRIKNQWVDTEIGYGLVEERDRFRPARPGRAVADAGAALPRRAPTTTVPDADSLDFLRDASGTVGGGAAVQGRRPPADRVQGRDRRRGRAVLRTAASPPPPERRRETRSSPARARSSRPSCSPRRRRRRSRRPSRPPPPTALTDYVEQGGRVVRVEARRTRPTTDAGTVYDDRPRVADVARHQVGPQAAGVRAEGGEAAGDDGAVEPGRHARAPASGAARAADSPKRVKAPVAFLYGVPKQPLFDGKTRRRADRRDVRPATSTRRTRPGRCCSRWSRASSGRWTRSRRSRKEEWKFEVKTFVVTGASQARLDELADGRDRRQAGEGDRPAGDRHAEHAGADEEPGERRSASRAR